MSHAKTQRTPNTTGVTSDLQELPPLSLRVLLRNSQAPAQSDYATVLNTLPTRSFVAQQPPLITKAVPHAA